MEFVPGLLIILIVVALFVAALRGQSGSGRGSAFCNHEWGRADAETGWDQKCTKCGAWKSGYGKTWR